MALHRKDDRPITWLAKYQVLKQTIKEVADSEKSEFLSDSAVQKAIERFAEEIDLTLRDGKRGKRKSKN